MLATIWSILLVFAFILAWILLLLVVGLSLRTGVEVIGLNGQVTADLRWGILRIPLYPPPGKGRRKKKKAKKPAAQAEQKTQKKAKKKPKAHYTLNRENLNLGEILDLVLRLLSELTDTLRISSLKVRVLLGTADAAKTGMLLGGASALTGVLVPFCENTFAMHDYAISIDADFDSHRTKWAGKVFFSLRPIHLLFVVLRHGKELYHFYRNLLKKEETSSNE